MTYAVKEVFYTLQGEEANTSRFLQTAGCNLWSRPEAARAGAMCQFCETDFVGTDGPVVRPYGATATKVSPDGPASGLFEQNTNIMIHTGLCGG